MLDIRVNKPLRHEIRVVGNEKTPVIVVDQPIESADGLIDYARHRAEFRRDSRFAYPGIRAELPAEYMQALVPELVELLSDVYEIPASREFGLIHSVYSLVTSRPEELGSLQRVPHFDHHSPFYFATVHYLNPGEHAGTGLFRHRPTGYERVPENRYPAYVRSAERHIRAHGLPAEQYINASDDHFELIAELEYAPNRLVMYPGNMLHSGLIVPERDIDADPASGRLTANLFMYFDDPRDR